MNICFSVCSPLVLVFFIDSSLKPLVCPLQIQFIGVGGVDEDRWCEREKKISQICKFEENDTVSFF